MIINRSNGIDPTNVITFKREIIKKNEILFTFGRVSICFKKKISEISKIIPDWFFPRKKTNGNANRNHLLRHLFDNRKPHAFSFNVRE